MVPRATQNKRLLVGVASIVALVFLYFISFHSPSANSIVYVDKATGKVISDFTPSEAAPANQEALQPAQEAPQPAQAAPQPKAQPQDPIKDNVDEEKAALQQIGTNENGDCVIPGERVKATFVSLARNEELFELIKAIRNVEDRFNRKFHYDWVFLNDKPFTEEFKALTSAIVSGNAKYGQIPPEHWGYPEWIDQKKAAKAREDMKAAKIIYGDSESYRHMCRFESGFFWRNPLLEEYDWYWRVEPGIQVHCDLNYDLFKFMEDNNKVYGFTISIHEFQKTIPTLWQHTSDFIKLHPEYIAEDNFMDFISDDGGKTYNLCHFWSNFEVASLKFWRSQAYRDYFDYLDKTGGFFYERWGDAPVHSIAAALFLPKDKIHYFGDVGYNHGVYTQCPLNAEFRYEHKCDCNPIKDFTFRGYSCGRKYYDVMKMERPKEWVHFQ